MYVLPKDYETIIYYLANVEELVRLFRVSWMRVWRTDLLPWMLVYIKTV